MTDTSRFPRTQHRALSAVTMPLAAILILATVLPSPALPDDSRPAPGAFVSSGAPHQFGAGVFEFVFTSTRGPSSFDRIALHRITTGPVPPTHPKLVMLYLPGTNMNGNIALDDPRYSMPLYLAAHGVDVWALDYRTHFVPPSTPQSGLAELKTWTNELFLSDIDAAARFVTATTGRKRIFLSGFSRGVNFAYLDAAAHPERISGLILFDGWIGHGRAGTPPPDIYAEDLGGKHLTWEKRDALMKLVIQNPNAPAPIPKYKSASDNLDHVVYDSGGFGGKGGLSNPFGGFSRPDVLARVLIQYDRYWPIVQDYEDSFTTQFTGSLAKSKIPVLAFSSTNIAPDWPQKVAQSAHSTTSADVTVKTLPGWGHLDVICGTHAEAEVYAPTVAWLKQHQK